MSFIEVLINNMPSFLAALVLTLQLAVCALIIATIIGTITGIFTVSVHKTLQVISGIYIDLIRGTPLLVQTFIIYYGLAQVLRPYGFQWAKLGGPFTAGVVTLSINAGAYMAEIVRGGITAVDSGQVEAARSLGLSSWQTMRKIILPQAFKTMLPSLINQFIISIKDTSLIYILAMNDLLRVARTIVQREFDMTPFMVAGVFYLAMTFVLTWIFKKLEAHYAKYDK